MAVTPESRHWDSLFAQRTRGDVGEGIAAVLAFLGVPNLISFAGGFPDPLTFPRERASALLAEFAAAGEAQAFQYAPTRGLAGPLDALAGQIETLQGTPRPGDDELLITSGGMEALRARRQVVPRPRRRGRRRGAHVSRRDHGVPELRGRGRRRADRRARAPGRGARGGGLPRSCGRSSCTSSRIIRTRPGSACPASGARRWSSSRAATAS